MNNFDLGLLLSFQDNASRGINSAVGALNELGDVVTDTLNKFDELQNTVGLTAQAMQRMSMQIAGQALSQFGNIAIDVGSAISNSFQGIINDVTQIGTQVMGSRKTLTMLFGSAEEGEKAFNWVKDFASTSVFEFENLLSAMTMMKSVGVDVRKELSTSSGKMQNLLLYAGDLAAVFPNMLNMYGTGVNAAMGALKEYIAEGNARSLLTGAGLDIQQILGETKGKDIETRSRQVADLIEKIGALGMTKSIEGTPSQMLGNLPDIAFNFKTLVSQKGVFEEYTQIVKAFTGALQNIPSEKLESLSQIVADSLVSLMKPARKLAEWFADFLPRFIDFVNEHPLIVRLGASILSLSSILLVLGGTLFRVTGNIVTLVNAFHTFFDFYGNSMKNFFSNIAGGIKSNMLLLASWALTVYLLYKAYDTNFMGIKDLLNNLSESFSTAWDLFSGKKISMNKWKELRDRGLVPLILSITRLIDLTDTLFSGISKGFSQFRVEINNALKSFEDFTGIDTSKLIKNINLLFGMGENGDINKWIELKDLVSDIGMFIGKWVLPMLVFSKLASTTFAVISGAISNIVRLAGFVLAPFKYLLALVLKIIPLGNSLVLNLVNALVNGTLSFTSLFKNAFIALGKWLLVGAWKLLLLVGKAVVAFFGGLPALAIIAMVALATIIYMYWGDIVAYVKEVWDKFCDTDFGKAMLSAWETVKSYAKSAIEGILDFFNPVVDLVNDIGKAIGNWKIGEKFTSFVSTPVFGSKKETNPKAIPTFATGGEIKNTRGLAFLDPHEVVLNSDLTNGLREFLSSQNAISNNTITFDKGSVVINVAGTSDSDLNEVADKLMNIMARKMQLRSMARVY